MGQAVARLFASCGAKVMIGDVDEVRGRATVADLAKSGGSVEFRYLDVSKAESVSKFIAETVQRYGCVNIAVNNAAVGPRTQAIVDCNSEEYDRIFSVDLKGVALSMQFEIAQMITQGHGGAVVNIGSSASFRPTPLAGAYTAAKHGVIGLTKVAAVENGVHGIRVNAVAPGATDTPMLREYMEHNQVSPEEVADQMSLLGRLATPEDIANACLFLCSDMSSYITGATICVDGGYVAC